MALNLDRLELLHQIQAGVKTLGKLQKLYGYKTPASVQTILRPLEKEGYLYRDENRKLFVDEKKLENTFKDIIVYINWFRTHYKILKPQKTCVRPITKIEKKKKNGLVKKLT